MTDPALAVDIQLPLDHFALRVAFETTHRVTGVFGASGSGKTSLLEAIAGLRRGTKGHIRFAQTTWLDTATKVALPPEKRGVGYVPQDSLLFPNQRVRQNLQAGRKRAIQHQHDFDATFAHVTDVLDIAHLLDRPVTTLSGGERQRVALGRALCSGPQLLLLDEPLASLDVGLRRKVLPFLHRVRAQFDVPMFLVSHNPVEVQALCDDLIVLRDGQIIARGAPRHVLTQPDVFPMAEHEGFENVLPARILESQAETSVLTLHDQEPNPVLLAPRSHQPVGSHVLVSIAANEIILATNEPRGLSARNILPARVASISKLGSSCLVHARLGDAIPPLVAEVTAQAVNALELAAGTPVFLIFKTRSLTVYEEAAA